MKKKTFTKKSLFGIFSGKRVLACVVLMATSLSFMYAQKWIDVTDAYIKDADYSSGGSDFWADGTQRPAVDRELKNAEFYQKNATAAQYIDVDPGSYKLTVRGFYRNGKNDNGAAFEDKTEEIKSFLFAGDNKAPLASLYSAPKNMLGEGASNTLNGWPDRMSTMRDYCNLDESYYVTTLEFSVSEKGKVLIGINSETSEGFTWSCWSDFKLYCYGTEFDALKPQLALLEFYRDSLGVLGISASAELNDVIGKYVGYDANTPVEDIEAALIDIAIQREAASAILSDCSELAVSVTDMEQLLADCEAGVYDVTDVLKDNLRSGIETARGTMQNATIAELVENVSNLVEDINEIYTNTMNVIGLSYYLSTAKKLADRIGGLAETVEYKKVLADLAAAELLVDDVMLDVQALNLVCKNKMNDAFLNAASDENPIDLTSFIVNPNIYQAGSSKDVPIGWTCDRNGADDGNLTNGVGDVDLNCYSWSGNENNQIGKSHYWQKIGGGTEGTVNLPDGLYVVKAATYVYNDLDAETPEKNEEVIQLYASPDSVNFSRVNTNADRDAYDKARKELGTTTELANVEVRGGVLYLGIKGKYIDEPGKWIKNNGRFWNADNFRLFYVNSSVLAAYQERLQNRIEKGEALHNQLGEYDINDDILTIALEEYSPLVTSESLEDLKDAIEGMDELLAMGKIIIENYKELSFLVASGEDLDAQLFNGLIAAQPTARNRFSIALETAEIVFDNLEWDNLYYNTKEAVDELKEALVVFKTSVAICYPLAKAKKLAERIGGMSAHPAYQQVVSDLKNDDLEQMDADLDVFELNAACVEAMTPAVLATASRENPFDMTSFIANPNVYQSSVEAFEADEVNGWFYDGIHGQGGRDGHYMTAEKEGDTWLYCGSWSGHAGNNIGLGNNYYQVVGANGEGTIALPNGTYRISAATYSTASGQIDLYAVTRESYMVGDEVAYKDSVEYVNTINGDKEKWDFAQATVGTTTDVSAIHVKNGSLCIGVKGNSVVGGVGRNWIADNFRLYYLNADEIPDSIDETLVDGDAQPEFVDVYDLTGRLIRSQVKADNAVEGLKKGFYIVGGKKLIVK